MEIHSESVLLRRLFSQPHLHNIVRKGTLSANAPRLPDSVPESLLMQFKG
jgi:hypothetical protein